LILALANPTPEILPEEVRAVRDDAVIATGRSDYPNQVNNVLCFPFIFRGALDVGATTITRQMEIATVHAIAELARQEQSDIVAAAYGGIEDLSFGPEYLIPKPFDPRLIVKIAPAVAKAAMDSGVATRPIADLDAKIDELSKLSETTGPGAIDAEIAALRERVGRMRQEVYSRLDPWQKTQIARHPERPHFLDYVAALIEDFVELRGDRKFADDQAIVGGLGRFRGQPVVVIGFESRPLPRHGLSPVDGPSQWTAGTLFPLSSKKTARAINAASGNRPLVILANLSGFDGSPESLRRLQLEYGAEIGRAIVNFDGPIVFCVVSRYHGGAFVVFSGTLNDNMEVAAVEGSYASVIGGAPAAAVVFAAEVNKRTSADPQVAGLQARVAEATSGGDEDEASRLRAELASVWPAVHASKLGQVADEFDGVHSIERAHQVGSVQAIVPPARLRSYLIDAVRRGMRRTLAIGASPDPG